MSWNEPDDRDDKGKKRESWGRQDKDGPPNIDEAIRQLQRKLRAVFGGNDSSINMENKTPNANRTLGLAVLGGVLLLAYVIGGVYFVEPAQEAVVLRFGRYVGTYGAGPHWIAPFIENKEIINVQEVKTTKHGGQMLTKDENIVSVEIAVQYRINNARNYLFNLDQPEKSLQQVSESALRAVVGQSTLNEVLTSGRNEIGAEIRKQVQLILNNYKSGLEISDLAMQQTKAPEEVRAAFDDAIKAQQDEERLVNEAEAYAHKIIPIAEGRAKRTFEEARAYKERVILEAQGKTAKFNEVYPEYQHSPQVTRERMFLDTMQEIYAKTPKIFIDVNNSNNVIYVPLDRLARSDRQRAELNTRDGDDVNAVEKAHPRIPLSPRLDERPTYEDAERPSRDGA